MKLPLIILTLIAVSVHAEEDCIFDETAYIDFINHYRKSHVNSIIAPDGKTLSVTRNNEEIIVTGGGCVHLGVAIESTSQQAYTEEQFLQKTLDLSNEFGNWLINTKTLKASIDSGNYQIIDGTYYFAVDAMTVFNASYNKQGKIHVDFYLN